MSRQHPIDAEPQSSPSPPYEGPGNELNLENTLCEVCRRVDFDGRFFQVFPRLDLFWSVGHLRLSSKDCAFCNLLWSSVHIDTYTSADLEDDWKIWGRWMRFGKYEFRPSKSRKCCLFPPWPQIISSLKELSVRISNFVSWYQLLSSQLHTSSEQLSVYKFVVSLHCVDRDRNHSLTVQDSGQCLLPHITGLEEHEKDRVLKCRGIDMQQVDFKLVRDWIKVCEKEHKSCPRPGTNTHGMETFKFRLLDVQREAVVDAPKGAKYFALSYVWGSTRQLKLLKENREELYKEGYLSPNNNAVHVEKWGATIPKTIQDAIYICKVLGERYLWVDALCIMQNCTVDVTAQVGHMDKIYRNAFITVVGALAMLKPAFLE